MQSRATLSELINISPEILLKLEFLRAGFNLVRVLPHRHYLMRKELKRSKWKTCNLRFRLFFTKIISRILQELVVLSYLFFKKIKCYELTTIYTYEISIH